MPQLDKFIKALHDHGGESLSVGVGAPIRMTQDGVTRAITNQDVTAPQVVVLLKELAPADAAAQIDAGAAVTFPYRGEVGSVEVQVEPNADGLTATLRAIPPKDLSQAAAAPTTAAPGTAQIDLLLNTLVGSGSSDLHLRVGEPPIYRKDGVLERGEGRALSGAEIQAMLDAIAPEKDRIKHRDTGDADFAYEIPELARFRVNAAMDRGGPMAVFRVIPSEIPTCGQLAITKEVQALCYLTKGLVVVTGPTGSGKSTTLAALVNKMNFERDDHILTIEDPIEFVHKSRRCLVTHRQVGEHTQSFKAGLRAALREDPDIVLIGELRDLETVAIAIETAETGHLVFGTLHTTTASSTVDRIIDQFPADRQSQIRVMLSESLRGVVAQTLCRKKGGGRVAAREILLTTSAVSNLIREGKTFQLPSVMQTSKKIGMITLNESLLKLVDDDLVEPKEAYMKAVDKAQLVSGLQARGHDTSFVK